VRGDKLNIHLIIVKCKMARYFVIVRDNLVIVNSSRELSVAILCCILFLPLGIYKIIQTNRSKPEGKAVSAYVIDTLNTKP
jgi:hypothetical protein